MRVAWAAWAQVTPVADFHQYDELALHWLKQHEWRIEQARAWRAPGYPFFLATVYATVGHSWRAVAFLQAVLGALSALLLALLASRVASVRLGIVAGLLWAVLPVSVLYVPVLASENLAVPALLGGLVLLAHIGRGTRPLSWASASGLLLGTAILARPAAVFCLPGWLLAVAYDFHSRRWRLPAAAACALAVLVVVGPWLVRNARLGLGYTLATTGSFCLAMGNCDGGSGGWYSEAVASWQGYRGEAERHRARTQAALDWIRSHPGPYLRLCGARAACLFGPEPDRVTVVYAWPTAENDMMFRVWIQRDGGSLRDVPSPVRDRAITVERTNATVLTRVRWVWLCLVGFGALLALPQWRRLAPVLLPSTTYVAGICLTFVDPRFRSLVEPAAAILAAHTLTFALSLVTGTTRNYMLAPRGAHQGGEPPRGVRDRPDSTER